MTNMDVVKETHLFVDKLRESEVYKEYTEAKENIKKDPELYRQVNEFRMRNFDLQHNTSEDMLMDALDAFEEEYEDFRANPLVDAFLSAELALCRMLQEIYEQVTEELDFE